MLGVIKTSENYIKQYNKELMQLFGDLDILSFARISWLNWIGHVNRMNSKRKVSKYSTINLREVDYKDDQKTDGGIVYKQILINAKLQIGKRGQKHS
jgi:hypothetical protein